MPSSPAAAPASPVVPDSWDLGSTVVLDDGRRVTVRAIEPADTEPLREMHRRLSPATVQRRFHAPLPELSRAAAEHFTCVDGTERVALVAVDDAGRLVAVVRYDVLPGTAAAEVAVVVQDDYQHHGLGTALLRRLRAYGRRHGVERFVAEVLPNNRAMFGAFTDAGLRGTSAWDCGVVHMELAL